MYSFGPFTISTSDRLLRRSGEVVSLPPKVVETLLLLLEDPGELVTKEALLERVWGQSFVEENSIPQNISRLRRTLDPDFEGPSPIVTVPKRGYRLGITVIIRHPPPPTTPTTITPSLDSEIAISIHTTQPRQVLPKTQDPKPKTFPLMLATIAILIILAAIAAITRWQHHRLLNHAAEIARPSVAILGFDDLSANPQTAWIATALSETLYSELGANPHLRMVPNGSVAEMRSDLQLPHTASLSPETMADVRRNLDCDLVVLGHYLESDGKIRLDIVLQDARTSETLGTFSHTDQASNLLPLIALSGVDLRTRLGAQALSADQSNSLAASVPGTPNALQAYAEGMARLRALDAPGARPFFEQAIALQPNYPLAHAGLSSTWSLLGYDGKAIDEAKLALDLSNNLSREDRLVVEEKYEQASTQWAKAINTGHTLWTMYPDNLEYGLLLAHAMISGGKAQQVLEPNGLIAQFHLLPAPLKSDPRIALMKAEANHELANNPQEAQAAQAAIAAARERHDQFVLIDGLISLGNATNQLGQHAHARSSYAEARNIAQTLGVRSALAHALRLDAEALRQLGDLDAAKAELNDAINIATETNDRRGLISCLSTLTQIDRTEGDLLKQKEVSLKILAIARETSNKRAEAGALLDLGNEFNNMGDSDAGRKSYQQALDIARQIGNNHLQSMLLGNLGIIEYRHGRLAAGEALLQQGIEFAREIGDQSSVAYKLGHLANIYEYEAKFPEAQAALREQCAIVTALGEKDNTTSCQVQQASLQSQTGNAAAAIPSLVDITAKYKTLSPALHAWMDLAEARLQTGDIAGAKAALDQAQQFNHSTVDEGGHLIPLALTTGEVQSAMGKHADATRTFQKVLTRATALQLVPLQLIARLDLAEIKLKFNPIAAHRDLKKLQSDAEQRSFLAIAQTCARQNSI